MSVGFVPVDAAAWSAQRLLIPGPWPEVLAAVDLRYWADPKANGHQRRPSYRDLAAAWGWSLGRVQRFVIDADRWVDPWRERYAGGTPVEHGRYTGDTADHGETPETDEPRDTDGTPAEHARNTSGTGRKETRARSTGTGTGTDGSTSSAADATERRRLERELVAEVWEHWRQQRRPGADGKPGRPWHTSRHFDPDDQRKVLDRLRERAKSHRQGGLRFPADLQAAASDARALIDCFHQAPACAHWQGQNERGRVYLGLGTLFKRERMGTRWEALGQWEADGRPLQSAIADDSSTPDVYKAEAEAAWPWLLDQVAVHGMRLPRPLAVHDPAKDAALWSAIEAIGDVTALCGRADAVQRLRWPFVNAYVNARQETP